MISLGGENHTAWEMFSQFLDENSCKHIIENGLVFPCGKDFKRIKGIYLIDMNLTLRGF